MTVILSLFNDRLFWNYQRNYKMDSRIQRERHLFFSQQ